MYAGEIWAEFLLKLGFKDTAYAFSEVLQELYKELHTRYATPEEYIDDFKNAKVVNEFGKKREMTDEQKERYEELKKVEIARLTKNKRNMEKERSKPIASLGAFNREFKQLSSDFPNMYVAYKNGEFLGVSVDKKQLKLTVDFNHGVKPDLIRKIEV